jgi:hypothetical protein
MINNPSCAVYVQGPPGVGKTSIPFQVAAELGVPVYLRHPLYEEPVDHRGIPHIANGVTTWSRPDFFGLKNEPLPERAVFLLDEYGQCDQTQQKAYATTLLEKKICDFQLPQGWLIMATGNRVEDRAGAQRLLSHVINRTMVIELTHDIEDFQKWGVATGKISSPVRAFLNWKPSALLDFKPELAKPYASPRSWEKVSALKIPDHLRREAIAGLVGEGHAAEMLAFERTYASLQDPKDVIKAPLKAKVPEQPDVLCAMIESVSEYVRLLGKDEIMNAVKWMQRIPKEYQAMMFTQLSSMMNADKQAKRSEGKELVLLNCLRDSGWIKENADLLRHAING